MNESLQNGQETIYGSENARKNRKLAKKFQIVSLNVQKSGKNERNRS